MPTLPKKKKRKLPVRPLTYKSKLLRKRPKGVWQADLVDRIKSYPKTQEAYDKLQARCRAQTIRLHAEGKLGRNGVPDGWAGRKPIINKIMTAARAEAREIVEDMTDKKFFEPDCEEARVAMEACVSMIVAEKHCPDEQRKVPLYQPSARQAAIKTVLEYTQRKPVARTEAKLEKAEDFLAMLVAKE
ncbi:MAG: hypothetical protein V4457_12805 [Pseudomonadota bacterium]